MRNLTVLLLLSAAALTSCMTGPPPPPEPPSPQAMADLQRLTQGKVPGTPIACLPNQYANDMRIIDGQTLGFKVGGGGSSAYVVHLTPGCELITRGHYALAGRQIGSGLCRGDIQQVIDNGTRAFVGTCTIADVIPYYRPR